KSIQFDLVITNDNARVELYIGSSDKEYNKNVFDFYNSHKQEIEEELSDYVIIWQRLDKGKASRIALVDSDVNPSDEKCWDEGVNFLIKVLSDFVPVMSKSRYRDAIIDIK